MIGRWFVGFSVFVGYLCLGAFVFYRIERREEERRHAFEKLEQLELAELLAKHYNQNNAYIQKQFIQQLNKFCNKTVLEDITEETHQYQWTYYNAFFFALTTLSTIGYGNLHPTSCTGRILVLVYSLIGIPLNGIVLNQLGSFFESRILRAHYSYKTQRMMGPQLSLIVDIISYLIPGIIVFILVPSAVISHFEQWEFDESVYFAFVTLTTIGYGDFVAGQTVNTNIWYNAYKVFLVFWIMFGLGYLFMILSFISRAMRSKTLEHIFLERVKQTHSKIWNQFTKDVVYIRRVLNESYLMKFKPVYKREVIMSQPLRRSRSAPNLTEWPVLRKLSLPTVDKTSEEEDEEVVRKRFEKHRMKRRRALSQNKMRSLIRRVRATSEIDLAHIDKEATFGADIASYELLSRVVDALETAVPNKPDVQDHYATKKKAMSFSEGIQGFSSQEILASEKNEWTIGGDMINRETTFSEKHSRSTYFEYDTWAGADNRSYKKFNSYPMKIKCPKLPKETGTSVNRASGCPPKPRVPRLRRMSAAAFNFLSHNIAPRWLSDKLSDKTDRHNGQMFAAVAAKKNRREWTNNPKHRLSLNDDGNCNFYGSTLNGNVDYRPFSSDHDTFYPSSESRSRRQSSPDPVLTHCANTIAVADFLYTLQRSLNKSSSLFPDQKKVNHEERRSPLFTLFQDRRQSLSGDSWQYSSLASTVSTSTTSTAPAAIPTIKIQDMSVNNAEVVNMQELAKPKKKRIRRFSIRPTVTEPAQQNAAGKNNDVRLNIED
ncbi:open rectifier potassium channel protein 1 isoform X2 [Daktulosphaira vitifoliae]|uniref:open rectifier potassium channel protein 1 isoform X2 n=1 Tax=Daktulosphaira vitifoliae TaxID=58002 RepID=UPI0021A9785D|nr:open rectifier potassium channel protein 1 isoform X2 [Daktulosphaira vitifoliae]